MGRFDNLASLLFQEGARKDQLNQRGLENTIGSFGQILQLLQANKNREFQGQQAQLGRDQQADQFGQRQRVATDRLALDQSNIEENRRRLEEQDAIAADARKRALHLQQPLAENILTGEPGVPKPGTRTDMTPEEQRFRIKRQDTLERQRLDRAGIASNRVAKTRDQDLRSRDIDVKGRRADIADRRQKANVRIREGQLKLNRTAMERLNKRLKMDQKAAGRKTSELRIRALTPQLNVISKKLAVAEAGLAKLQDPQAVNFSDTSTQITRFDERINGEGGLKMQQEALMARLDEIEQGAASATSSEPTSLKGLVAAALAAGRTPEQIRQVLAAQGFTDQQIAEAMK